MLTEIETEKKYLRRRLHKADTRHRDRHRHRDRDMGGRLSHAHSLALVPVPARALTFPLLLGKIRRWDELELQTTPVSEWTEWLNG